MEQNKVNSFLLANKDNLPSDKIVYIKEKLNKADESLDSHILNLTSFFVGQKNNALNIKSPREHIYTTYMF